MPARRKPKGLGDFLKRKTKEYIDSNANASTRKTKPQRKVQTRTVKHERKGMGKTGVIGRASARRDNRLNSIMGEIQSTRKKRK